jgi:hypothetical protein
MKKALRAIVAACLMAATGAALAFDQKHAAWDTLLKHHVVVAKDGNASRVDYAGLHANPGALQSYLGELSSVTQAEYRGWTRDQQLAFLVNAYNAFTVKLILTRYPDLKSIKDIGSILKSPWKKEFFPLLGSERSLDNVEHVLIRAPGVFDEPRVHFALNCASIGCPMLRGEAYIAERLGVQLEDAVKRFLGDRSRNRYDPAAGTLEVSKIFDWYKEDFEKANQGTSSVHQFLARYAELLADGASSRSAVRQGNVRIHYLDYDWNLNDARR